MNGSSTIPHLTAQRRCTVSNLELADGMLTACREIDGVRVRDEALCEPKPSATCQHRHRRGRIEEGKLYLFVAIDRTSKFAFVQLVERANTMTARDFLGRPDRGRALQDRHVLTDNGMQFADAAT